MASSPSDDKMPDLYEIPFFLRWRGIAVDVLIAAAFCSGPPWAFGFVSDIGFTFEQLVFLAVIAVAVLSIVITVSLRVRKRMLAAQDEIRGLREQLSDLEGGCAKQDSSVSLNMANRFRGILQNCDERAGRIKSDEDAYDFVSSVCDCIASVFQEELGDQAIDCSIRLASPDHVRYETVGRSTRLSIDRRKHTEPVTGKSCIYKELTEGISTENDVIVIEDVDRAISEGRITCDYNMSKYGDEIKSMMVCRLNVLRNSKSKEIEDLWGILYVSSPKKSRFMGVHANRLKELSPFVSATLWQVSSRRLAMGEESEQQRAGQSSGKGGQRKSGGRKRTSNQRRR